MWFKHRAWIPFAWLASFANFVAAWPAAAAAEPWHATTHALLAVAFALGARRLKARQQADTQSEDGQHTIEQNEHLQQTVEVLHARLQELEERMDFAERLLTKHRDLDRPGVPPS